MLTAKPLHQFSGLGTGAAVARGRGQKGAVPLLAAVPPGGCKLMDDPASCPGEEARSARRVDHHCHPLPSAGQRQDCDF